MERSGDFVQGPGFVVFATLHLDRTASIAPVLDAMAGPAQNLLRGTVGLHRARLHAGKDVAVVALGTWWTDRSGYLAWLESVPADSVLRHPETMPGVVEVIGFEGVPLAHIDGPAAGERPGLMGIVTRHVGNHESARAVADLLERTGDWKDNAAGFVSATASINSDGTRFFNYPQWVDQSAYDAYMADPRLSEAQDDVAQLEAAAPEFLLCTLEVELLGGELAAAGNRR